MTVAKLRGARDRKRKANGKCEGRKSLAEMYPGVVREAKRLARANPKTGERRSLRKIAAELAKIGGVLADTGTPGPKRPRAPTSPVKGLKLTQSRPAPRARFATQHSDAQSVRPSKCDTLRPIVLKLR
jgi:hypothetical protein